MKVLIVDDDALSRRVLRQIVAMHGSHEIIEASDGMEAFAILEAPEHGVDVMFLDINMPGLDGLEVLRLMREIPDLKKLPVVLCTSASDRTSVIRAAQLGVLHYVVKPPRAEVVHERLNSIRGSVPAAKPKVLFAR